jgi:hypothetical protein
MTRPFRFGVLAPIQTELPAWRDRVRRIELARHVPVIGDTRAPFMAPPVSTRLRFARRTHWPYFRLTRRLPPKKSSGDGRKSASPISSSAPTSPTRSLRSWLSWPGTRPGGPTTRLGRGLDRAQ